jgi:hypothetical protein
MPVRNLLAAAALAASVLPASALELLVPAYFYPSFDPAQSQWDEMTGAAAAGARITAIMNPANGPGAAFNADYAQAVNAFRAAGGRVLGYVYTCYGGTQCFAGLPPTRSTAEVLADAQRYADWYAVDGIFLDEMANVASALPFYETVATGLRGAQPQWQIVGNPGTSAPEAWLAVADTLVTFERGTGSYDSAATEPWMGSAPPERQAHLHYNVETEAAMRALAAEAQARGAGWLYITDDRYVPGDPSAPNPWDRLPSYWTALAALATPVPEPAPAALLAAGIAALALRRRPPRS